MYNLEDKIAVNSRVPTAWLSDGVEIAPLWFPGPFFIISFLWQEVSPVPKFVFSDSDLQPSLHYNPGSRSPGPGIQPWQTQLRSLVPLRGSTFLFWLRRNASLSASSVVHDTHLPSLSSFSFVMLPETVSLNVYFAVLYIRFSNHTL